MVTRRMRLIGLAIAVGCLLLGAAFAANLALLGLADQPPDRVGRLQLRLSTFPPAQPASSTARPPAIVESAPPPLRVADDETGADD
jgi:hypothetical protein